MAGFEREETPCFALLLSGLLFARVGMAAGYKTGRVGQRQGSEPELFYSEGKKGRGLFSKRGEFSNTMSTMFLETFLD